MTVHEIIGEIEYTYYREKSDGYSARYGRVTMPARSMLEILERDYTYLTDEQYFQIKDILL